MKTTFACFFVSAVAFASQTFYIDAPERGKQYQVTTTARGIALSINQRWFYQPSVVKMDDGSTRSVMQNYEPLLVVGDRVRVLGTQVELVQ